MASTATPSATPPHGHGHGHGHGQESGGRKVGLVVGAIGVVTADNLAKISIVGTGMRSHAGVAAKMFKALADEKINILSIGTSEIKISCLIESKYAELATRILHEAFALGSGSVAGDRDL